MGRGFIDLLITDGLWFVVVAGWVILLIIGLEADRPMSGGLPGHAVAHEDHAAHREGMVGKIGEYGAWLVFTLITLSLPIVLWWIFAG